MEETFMTAVATPDAARLVFAAVAGLILLLILIIKFKVHAMISILIGAVGIGLMAGMPCLTSSARSTKASATP